MILKTECYQEVYVLNLNFYINKLNMTLIFKHQK
jgi:hypothetical protein